MSGGLNKRSILAGRGMLAVASISALAFGSIAVAQPAVAQVAAGNEAIAFDIPAQSLNSALLVLAQRAGLRLVFDAQLVAGKQAAALRGRYVPAEALSRLLAGTGLSYRLSGANSVTIERGPQVSSDSVQLGPLRVEGSSGSIGSGQVAGEGGDPVEQPYRTTGAVSHVTRETIDRYRGSSPADVLRGIPGVMSGEARGGAGSIDVNIRGMQGMGRVTTTIDGAENGMMVYQGYQGMSNRSYVDPDLVAGIDVTRGSDSSSRGIAGSVVMRTFNADDIVKDGESFGIRLNLGFSGNTSSSRPRDLGGYNWPQPYVSNPQPYPVPTAYDSQLKRPSALDPTAGSASVVMALKQDAFDLVVGYAHRKQGNYFAGGKGPGAQVIDTGPQPLCYPSGLCYNPPHPISYAHVYQNGGLSSYRVNEQVLNTELETDSWIAKATFRFGDGHALQLGYSGFRSEAGDILAANFQSPKSQAVQGALTSGTKVDSGTLRYHWKPENSDLIDLKANLWLASLRTQNPARIGVSQAYLPEDFGLPFDFRPGNNSRMWGGDIANTTALSIGTGTLTLNYGASFIDEDTKPTEYSDRLNSILSRNGSRNEFGAFIKGAYKPVDWLTVDVGLRYSHYSSNDRSPPDANDPFNDNPRLQRDGDGWSPSVGLTVEPVHDLQLYARYSSTLRMPTLFESVKGYTVHVNGNLVPERSRNWEVGANLIRSNVFADGDKAMLKLGYFNWNVQDFVAREFTSLYHPTYQINISTLQIYNVAKARFAGIEASGRYEIGGFSAEVAANYYTQVDFCRTTANCANQTLSADYATNQVPPSYTVNLSLAQKLFDERLTVGGRGTFVGKRAAGHGTPMAGLQTLISVVNWRPYATADFFADYKLTPALTVWTRLENAFDKYYVDPLSIVNYASPGRTVRIGVTGNFGDPRKAGGSADDLARDGGPIDWSGFRVGFFAGYDLARFNGQMATRDGSANIYLNAESPRRTLSGFVLGVSAGYDRQFSNRVVIGVVADIARSQAGGPTAIAYANEGQLAYQSVGTIVQRRRNYEGVLTSQIEWMSTLRARVGYGATDRLMVYGTGGLALLRERQQRDQYAFSRAADIQESVPSQRIFSESASAVRSGFVLGGGAEYALDRRWSISGEGLISWFGSRQMAFPNARAGVMADSTVSVFNPGPPPVVQVTQVKGSGTTVVGRELRSGLTVPTIRIGVNYRF